MQRITQTLAVAAIAVIISLSASADDTFNIGGDVYSSGADVSMNVGSPRDIFLSGFSANLDSEVADDAHVIAFNVNIDGAVGGNLYVAGSNVEIGAPVGRDLSVSGFNVKLDKGARVTGNSRIVGATVSVDGLLEGALLASGGTIRLNNVIEGDVRLAGSKISFGENARIQGRLDYSAPAPVAIPEAVIPSNRVTYQPLSRKDVYKDMQDAVDKSIPGFWPSLATRLLSLLVLLAFFLITAAVFLAFTPRKVEQLRSRAREHGWRSLVYGFLGLSTLVGAIPVSIMTIVGIPFVPLVMLALVLFWMLSYLLGTYVIAIRVWESMDINPDSVFSKLLILASGLLALMIVNMIPILGWMINIGVMLFGLGALTYLLMERIVRRHDEARSEGQILLTDDSV